MLSLSVRVDRSRRSWITVDDSLKYMYIKKIMNLEELRDEREMAITDERRKSLQYLKTF